MQTNSQKFRIGKFLFDLCPPEKKYSNQICNIQRVFVIATLASFVHYKKTMLSCHLVFVQRLWL